MELLELEDVDELELELELDDVDEELLDVELLELLLLEGHSHGQAYSGEPGGMRLLNHESQSSQLPPRT